jgi:hypothetical protein
MQHDGRKPSILGSIMSSYFDPKSWSPVRAAELGRSWIDQWLSTTASWVDPVATLGAGTVTALLPDVVMTVLSDGILSRFGGQRIELTLYGHTVTALLKSLRVRRQGALFQSKIELVEVDWDGFPVDALTFVANGVRLVPGVPTRAEAAQIDLEGALSTATLLEWLTSHELDWDLDVTDDGLIRARHPRRKLTAIVDASIVDDLLRIDVQRARWLGVPLPAQLLTSRAVPLSPLPNDARIVRASRDDHIVRFTLDIPTMAGSLDLTQIRNAIVAGTALIIW